MTRRRLRCACCGGDAGRWTQWFNQDTGYGICQSCVQWQLGRRTDPTEIARHYGKEGVNYAPKEVQPSQT
jgi:hypothetical protein